jgi:hypothetical protein
MKRSICFGLILTVVFILFAGCATVNPLWEAYNRFAVVTTPAGYGSATCIGSGLFITARHIVEKDSSLIPFTVINEEGRDSLPKVIFAANDIAIIRSRLGRRVPAVELFYAPSIGEQIVFVQPFLLATTPDLNVLVGRIARISRENFIIDRPSFRGVSGSGVFNPEGHLVGICTSAEILDGQVISGEVARLDTLKSFLKR